MKKITSLVLIFLSITFLTAQTTPTSPTVAFISRTTIAGTTPIGTIVHIDLGNNSKEIEVSPDILGGFLYDFKTLLVAGSTINIWSENKSKSESSIKTPKIIPTDKEAQATLEDSTKKLQTENESTNQRILFFENEKKKIEDLIKIENDKKIKEQIEEYKTKGYKLEKIGKKSASEKKELFDAEKLSLANTTINYKATIWNTNFSIPIARFNFTRDTDNKDTKDGELILFNSIGAGFGISWGEIKRTRDSKGDIIDEDFTSTFGVNLGVLFSAGSGEDNQNVFAPILSVSVLDFQLGLGYELGTIKDGQQKTFLTIAYAIPLYKLTKGKFWIWKSNEGEQIDDTKFDTSRQGVGSR